MLANFDETEAGRMIFFDSSYYCMGLLLDNDAQLTEDHRPDSARERERIELAGGEVVSQKGMSRVVWNRPSTGPGFYFYSLLGVIAKALYSFRSHSSFNKHGKYVIKKINLSSYFFVGNLNHLGIPFLAVARSLGDFWSLNPDNGTYVVLIGNLPLHFLSFKYRSLSLCFRSVQYQMLMFFN